MRARGALLSIAIAGLALAACHGAGPTTNSGGPPVPAPAPDTETKPPPIFEISEGPGGEIVPGIALPPTPGATKPGPPGSAAPDPAKLASQEQLLVTARQALAENRPADALAIIDVLVVLDPEDAAAIELRARTLEQLGDADGARADRERCCKAGRATCCP